MFILAMVFMLGDLYLQTFPQLPDKNLLLSFLLGGFIVAFWLRKYFRYYFLLIAFMLGFTYTYWYASNVLMWILPKALEGKPVWVKGYIASLPVIDQWQTSFLFFVTEMQFDGRRAYPNTLVRLASRDSMRIIRVGSEWKFLVRLKRIHSTQNPGAFDFEAWSLQKGLRATGYILAHPDNQRLSHNWYRYPIDQFRQFLQDRIKAQLPATSTAPWLMALMIGERNGIAQEDWRVLRNTGTNHLMAIAGLHIGIMAGFAHVIGSWLWRRRTHLLVYWPAHQVGACAALVIAVIYSMLAGFSIPTQRACLMLTVFILMLLLRRKINSWYSWSFALLLVLLLNPLSVLTESFWLSFGTIALIIYGMSGRLAPHGWWWKWGRVQWVIGVGLIPITLMLFQQCSLSSFAANSIAIPWLGFFILPFCFLSSVCLLIYPPLGGLLLVLADKSLSGLWIVLTWFSQLSFSTWYQVIPNSLLLFLTVIGFIILLVPAGFPGRWLGVFWILPLLFYQHQKPKQGDIWLTLLDVGQGLSVVVQTQKHLLVYDAGPKFNANFDMGESVVLPYLRTLGVNHLDRLVISHGDNDHIGGAQAVLAGIRTASVRTSVPHKINREQHNHFASDYCFAGEKWRWDGVDFSFLYPMPNKLNLGNDSSCVMLIDNGKQRILLTGDIEKNAEETLINLLPASLNATVLIAPHHGSKTSGLAGFVNMVHPQFVLYAIGYRNRYHFPHPSIVSAYDKIHAKQFNTAESGAIQIRIEKNGVVSSPTLYRKVNRHYWFD